MEPNRISYLFNQLESNSITIEEREELYSILRSFENNDEILALLEDSYKNTLPQPADPARWRPILERILQTGRNERKDTAKGATIVRMRKSWIKWVAAACIIIAIAVVGIVTNNRKGKTPPVAVTHDVPAPSNTRAVITLANGQKVYLDSVSNGTIAQENNVDVVKNEKGEIIYSHKDTKTQGEIAYNTLSNPRGSKVISLTLSDGTKVWLNSESSLRYPASFALSALNREVEITGEAYFEVKHNSKQPFKVHLPNGSTVEDIGTSFNINAYPDEDATKTTLIEGSVKISSRLSAFLAKPKPGEQVIEKPNSPLTIDHSPDIEEVTAWKDGTFHFESADLKTILKEFARWYDIDVIYEGPVSNEKYFTIINRTTNLNDVLKSLQANNIQFRIEGKKLFVVSG